MQLESLAQLYSSKTDDELIALAADRDSLLEGAQRILIDELRRRNLLEKPLTESASFDALGPSAARNVAYRSRIRWLGLWLVNTLVATYGVAFAAGLTLEMWKPFISHATKIRIGLTPYYPFMLFFGLLVGFISHVRFRGSYRLWVWILPALGLLRSLLLWKANNRAAWPKTLFHFFGFMPYPENHDQLDTSLLLYLAFAYMLGVFVQTVTELRRTDFRKHVVATNADAGRKEAERDEERTPFQR